MKTLIRYANLEDSAVLGKIHSQASLQSFRNIIPDHILEDVFSTERRTQRFMSEIAEGSPKTAIAFYGDEPAALLSFAHSRVGSSDKSWIEIWRVYTVPKFWGSGIAKELMEWGIHKIQKENYKNLELWVLEENNRARKFYEKMGFYPDGNFQIVNMDKELKELRYIKVLE